MTDLSIDPAITAVDALTLAAGEIRTAPSGAVAYYLIKPSDDDTARYLRSGSDGAAFWRVVAFGPYGGFVTDRELLPTYPRRMPTVDESQTAASVVSEAYTGILGTVETLRGNARDADSFREIVRNMAIRLHKEGQWCRDGLNEHLEELGLPSYSPRYTVTVEVTVTVDVTADDESDARDAAETMVADALRSAGDDDTIGEPYVSIDRVRAEECDTD